MSAAAAVFALALVCVLVFFVMETRPKKPMSMLDLVEFKELPTELRSMIKSIMPNPKVLKRQWANLTPQQKQAVLHSVAHQIPRPQPPPPPRPPAPSVVIKPEPEPAEIPEEPVEVPEPVEIPEPVTGLKSGFLLSKSVDQRHKKNTKDKKQNKIVTLSDVGASEDESTIVEVPAGDNNVDDRSWDV